MVEVFARFHGPAAGLRDHGFALRSVAGDVATMSIALRDVARAASAPGVEYIQLSSALAVPPGTRPDGEPRRLYATS